MHKILAIAAALLMCSCSGVNLGARIAWADQPDGARGAFLRCVYLMAEKQCGSSDLNNPAIKACMVDAVSSYKLVDGKGRSKWLMDRGCREDMAQLRADEV